MKHTTMLAMILVAALVTIGAASAQAVPPSKVAEIKKAVENVPAPELAAKASSIVAAARASDRLDIAIATVRVIVKAKPSVAPSVVGAISKVSPEVSAAVAAEAVLLSPDQATEIVKAAASAAPEQADKIAAAVAKAAPQDAANVARAAVKVVPSASPEIVESVVAAAPSAASEIQNDASLNRTRVTVRSAASTGPTKGGVSSFAGTIRGFQGGGLTGISSGQVTQGADGDRAAYGRPR